jgi:hypothetical protein
MQLFPLQSLLNFLDKPIIPLNVKERENLQFSEKYAIMKVTKI